MDFIWYFFDGYNKNKYPMYLCYLILPLNFLKMYSLYAWGVPLIIVAIGHATDHIDIFKEYRPFYAGRLCWINSTLGLGIFYGFPIACLVLENVVFFVITLVCIFQLRYDKDYLPWLIIENILNIIIYIYTIVIRNNGNKHDLMMLHFEKTF